MRYYQVKLKPLDYWFFGSERNLGFGRKKVRTPYFVISNQYPSQTTILGMIRYLLLKQNDCLNSAYAVNEALIGEKSFDMNDITQSFGKIKAIGPLFIIDKKDNVYIPCPLNDRGSGKEYQPYRLVLYDCGFEKNQFVFEDFDAKTFSLSEDFLKLPADNKETISIVSKSDIFIEKNKNRTHKTLKEDGYFKQKLYNFNKDYNGQDPRFAFSFVLSVEKDLKDLDNDMVMMGGGKSGFSIEFITIEEGSKDLLEDKISTMLHPIQTDFDVYYVVSDTVIPHEIAGASFSVTKQEFFRNLITKTGNDNFVNRYSPGDMYTVIKAGSIFYTSKENSNFIDQFKQDHVQTIGMNHIIKLKEKGER